MGGVVDGGTNQRCIPHTHLPISTQLPYKVLRSPALLDSEYDQNMFLMGCVLDMDKPVQLEPHPATHTHPAAIQNSSLTHIA